MLHHFIVEADKVCDSLAGFVGVEAVQLLEAGVGDLFDVFAYLDFGSDVALSVLGGNKLVNTAENG